MMRALIVDDHPVVREGIKCIVQEMDSFSVVEEVTSGREAIHIISNKDFDVVILDISLPDMNGLDVLEEMKQYKPDQKVLILSRHREEQYAVRAFKLGASGYINKMKVTDELVHAIRCVTQGRRYITSDLAENILELSLHPEGDKPPHTQLSDREHQVFLLLAEGNSVSECANQISLSPHTISTYRQRILEKLHLKTNAELARYAAENHLID